MEQSVPKRRHIKFTRRRITQKKEYNVHDMAKILSQQIFQKNFKNIRSYRKCNGVIRLKQASCSVSHSVIILERSWYLMG